MLTHMRDKARPSSDLEYSVSTSGQRMLSLYALDIVDYKMFNQTNESCILACLPRSTFEQNPGL